MKTSKLIKPGDVISYIDMCTAEGVNLQRGMNFRLKGNISIILMSIRKGAPYADRIEEEGKVLIYEGHDIPKTRGGRDPKKVNQQLKTPLGTLTQNGKFSEAVWKYKETRQPPELVKVYEKLYPGIWVYNGIFELIDGKQEKSNKRAVYKFKLRLGKGAIDKKATAFDLDHSRVIPSSVKLEVWKRDRARCVKCKKTDNLHFDHIIPFSRGGSSLLAKNIQLLCARHNLEKHDNIE